MTIFKNKFILGYGKEGFYSDLSIEIRKDENSKLVRGQNFELNDEEIINSIESEFKAWIDGYKKQGINLQITILNIGVDSTGRKYSVKNSVGGIMHKALPEIGIKPPQIFGL